MSVLVLAGAGYRYASGQQVGPVDLSVRAGERVLLTGPTGSGKSTILRLMAGLLQRQGQGQALGTVRVCGEDPARLAPAARPSLVGFVGQEPDEAVISGTVAGEVAFALESRGDPAAQIGRRVAEVLAQVGLGGREGADPYRLSGGQRQRLMVAAALAGGARVLLLDEPLAWLDPGGAEEILALLRGLGVAVVVVEHRLEQAWGWADRVVLMEGGRVRHDPAPGVRALWGAGLRGPAEAEIAARAGPGPWRRRGVPESGMPGSGVPESGVPESGVPEGGVPEGGAPVMRLAGVGSGWERTRALTGVSLEIRRGERVAVMGANGAGKSTLLGVMAGDRPVWEGRRSAAGRAVLVPQNPDLSLFCSTVAEEIGFALRERGEGERAVRAGVAQIAGWLSLGALLDRAPQALSRGQRLRVAVAAAVAAAPALLLLDEPTAGQDAEQVEQMFLGLRGMSLCFCCHDPEVALQQATRLVVMDGGRVLADGPPEEALLEAIRRGAPLRAPVMLERCRAWGLPLARAEVLAGWLAPEAERGAEPAGGAGG